MIFNKKFCLTVLWKQEVWHTTQGHEGKRQDSQEGRGREREMWKKGETLLCFLREDMGEAGQAGLEWASLNNFSRL